LLFGASTGSASYKARLRGTPDVAIGAASEACPDSARSASIPAWSCSSAGAALALEDEAVLMGADKGMRDSIDGGLGPVAEVGVLTLLLRRAGAFLTPLLPTAFSFAPLRFGSVAD
jgi:hypothetical protein